MLPVRPVKPGAPRQGRSASSANRARALKRCGAATVPCHSNFASASRPRGASSAMSERSSAGNGSD
jgi:hypothetical protein